MDNIIFLQGVNLIEIVTQKKFTEQQLKVYKMLLSDITNEQFITGIQELLKTRVYTNIPSPAEIREYALETRDGDLNIRSIEAAEKIKKAISSVGTHQAVTFDDPVIHLVIRSIGGWAKLGTLKIEEFESLMKWEFQKLYKAYSTRKNGEIPLMLEGRNCNDEVKLIGDKGKIKKWQKAYNNMIENKKEDYKSLENKTKIGE